MSLKEKIQSMAGDNNVQEFDNLILDEVAIKSLTADDKEYLQGFEVLEMISLNICQLNSLENFPALPSITRVELAENNLKGDSLKHLAGSVNIETLKLGNNKITEVSDLQSLAQLSKLKNLDLEGNPVCEKDEYKREAIFEMIPSLEVLDMVTKDGEDFLSDIDDDYGAEGGEDEMSEGEQIALLEAQMTDKQKQKLQDAGVSIQDYLAGNGPELSDEYDDEEGEEDQDGEDDADGEEVNGEKRAKQE